MADREQARAAEETPATQEAERTPRWVIVSGIVVIVVLVVFVVVLVAGRGGHGPGRHALGGFDTAAGTAAAWLRATGVRPAA